MTWRANCPRFPRSATSGEPPNGTSARYSISAAYGSSAIRPCVEFSVRKIGSDIRCVRITKCPWSITGFAGGSRRSLTCHLSLVRDMAEHKVQIERLPEVEIINADLKITVFSDGQKFGTLTISRGSMGWFPRDGKKEREIEWE